MDNAAEKIDGISEQDIQDIISKFSDFATVREFRGISDAQLEAVYSTGLNFYSAGKYAEAEKIFRFLVVFEHTSSRFWTALGSARQAQRKIDDALQAYQFASFLDLENPRPAYYAAECLLAKGDRENALNALKTLERYASKDSETGRRYLAKGAELRAVVEGK